ncbi:MAG: energy transducer TonB [Rikenellaceae bacterium]
MKRNLPLLLAIVAILCATNGAFAAAREVKPPTFDKIHRALFTVWAQDQITSYTPELKLAGVNGSVDLSFMLRASGQIDSIVVLSSPHPDLIDDAKRIVMESAELWSPAKEGRKNVDYKVKTSIKIESGYKIAKNKSKTRGYPYVTSTPSKSIIITYKDKDGVASGYKSGDAEKIMIANADLSLDQMSWDDALKAAQARSTKGTGRLPTIAEINDIYALGGSILSDSQASDKEFILNQSMQFKLRFSTDFDTMYGKYWLMDQMEDGTRAYVDFTQGECTIKSADPSEKLLARAVLAYDAKTRDSQKSSTSPTFLKVEEGPKFQGGGDFNDFRSWVASKVRYPYELIGEGVGRCVVTVRFSIEDDGAINDIDIISSPHYEFSKEAISVIGSCPKWTPAMQRGKNVKIALTVPIAFEGR